MREKLNENPVAQIALIAVLVLAAGYLVLSSMGGGSSEAATGSAEVEAAEPAAATLTTSAPGKRLPHAVEAAYAKGDTIALLIYRPGGIDDRALSSASTVIGTMPGVAFFDAPIQKIARYSAITGPVGVNRAPALVVVRARQKGGEPSPATVTYGFQGPDDVRQAVIDAGYTGPEPSYAPN